MRTLSSLLLAPILSALRRGDGEPPFAPVHRSIVALDIERFADPARTDPIRHQLRADLRQLLDRSLADAGVPAGACATADQGDGVLLLVDASVAKTTLLHPLVPLLRSGLARHNREAGDGAARLRLRAVVHSGELLTDRYGYVGAALNHACRLLDCEPLRQHLRVTASGLALAVSDTIYQAVVRHHYPGIDPADYQPVSVNHKETAATAWLYRPAGVARRLAV